jgi:hypothetical protein
LSFQKENCWHPERSIRPSKEPLKQSSAYGKNEMKKILLSFLCLILLGSVLAAQSTNGTRARRTAGQTPQTNGGQTDTGVAQEDEVLKIDTTLVTIPVSVFDSTGRFIPGLRKQDFQISEDGKVQQIDLFATTEQPFTVVLLIDVSRSTQFRTRPSRSSTSCARRTA